MKRLFAWIVVISLLLAVWGTGRSVVHQIWPSHSIDKAVPQAMQKDFSTSHDVVEGQLAEVVAPKAYYSENPQRQFHVNMTTAEKYCEGHSGTLLSISDPVIQAVLEGLDRMIAEGYKESLVRASGARLINHYYWAYLRYDAVTESVLMDYAAKTGAEYREPKYWTFGRDKGWW